MQPPQASVCEVNGDATLSAVGNSVASLLGASNGEIKTLTNQGTVSELLLEEIGLNIGNVILSHLFGDKQVKLNCMVTDFGVTNGLMQTRSFIIDTDDAIVDVSGNINLTQEQLDLKIKSNSKGLRVLSFKALLHVRGSFKHPSVSVDEGVLAMRAGSAIALSVLAPAATLIPLINTGPGENSDCAKLLADAHIRPQAPPPGKTYHRKIKPNVKLIVPGTSMNPPNVKDLIPYKIVCNIDGSLASQQKSSTNCAMCILKASLVPIRHTP